LPNSATNIQKIDRVIHEPARLTIMAQLFVVQSADFLFLQNQTGMTPGNLSAHLKKLENSEYVEIIKEYVERKPHTALKLTKRGRIAFKNYQQNLKQILADLPDE